ncbi:hypothetical protein EOA85_32785, partial [Mesorhizobium sp. M5C.F.Ca.IN.020.29.1.1]|uniref:hypothetical protein n=1 Tax=Mesorhizobium sp. M5C.F.Ca.IN.020.29.1.1 TaxID=2496770 RepID=UPI000FD31F9E
MSIRKWQGAMVKMPCELVAGGLRLSDRTGKVAVDRQRTEQERTGMEAAERAARIVRTVIETLQPGFAVKLWTGERIGPATGP